MFLAQTRGSRFHKENKGNRERIAVTEDIMLSIGAPHKSKPITMGMARNLAQSGYGIFMAGTLLDEKFVETIRRQTGVEPLSSELSGLKGNWKVVVAVPHMGFPSYFQVSASTVN